MDEPSIPLKDFDLDEYIASGAFEYNYNKNKQIRITLIFDAPAAYQLEESLLSNNQKMIRKRDGRIWWISHFRYLKISSPI